MKDLTEQEYIDKIKSGDISLMDDIPPDRQTEGICLEAVRNNGEALYAVKNQTEEICLAAVRSDGMALEYVENQNKSIYKEALNANYSSFIYIDAEIYEYDSEEILKIYNYIYNNKKNFFFKFSLNKIAEILNLLDNESLVKIVNIDLKCVFTKENLKLSEDLFNIKSKVDMIVGAGAGTAYCSGVNKKPKII